MCRPEAWRAHLIHDLRPYICTHESCKAPDQLYDKITDWIQHEIQHDLSAVQDSQQNHTASEALNFTPKLPPRSCPLCCITVDNTDDLYNHIARHLERISLFSLPRHTGQDEDKNRSNAGTDKESADAEVDVDDSRADDFSDSRFPSAPVSRAATPPTTLDKLDDLASKFHSEFVPLCVLYMNNPPEDPKERYIEYKQLSESIFAQVLLKLDGVEVEGDSEAKTRRSELVREVNQMINRLDEMNKRPHDSLRGGPTEYTREPLTPKESSLSSTSLSNSEGSPSPSIATSRPLESGGVSAGDTQFEPDPGERKKKSSSGQSIMDSESRNPNLSAILSNTAPPPYTLNAFITFLSQVHCLENLEFIMDAAKYRKVYTKTIDKSSPSATEFAYLRMIWYRLIDAYIRELGPREVNLSINIRGRLLHLADKTHETPHPSSFDDAVAEIHALLEETVLVSFLNSLAQTESYPAAADSYQQPARTLTTPLLRSAFPSSLPPDDASSFPEALEPTTEGGKAATESSNEDVNNSSRDDIAAGIDREKRKKRNISHGAKGLNHAESIVNDDEVKPTRKQPKWTPEEDNLTIELCGQGMKWDDIAKRLPGRTATEFLQPSAAPAFSAAFMTCPFQEMHPQKYISSRPFASVSRLKQHIYRQHRAHLCPKCWEEQKDEPALEDHVRQNMCTPRTREDVSQGISLDQLRQLKSRTSLGQLTKWESKRVFAIVFPNQNDSDMSPYL